MGCPPLARFGVNRLSIFPPFLGGSQIKIHLPPAFSSPKCILLALNLFQVSYLILSSLSLSPSPSSLSPCTSQLSLSLSLSNLLLFGGSVGALLSVSLSLSIIFVSVFVSLSLSISFLIVFWVVLSSSHCLALKTEQNTGS